MKVLERTKERLVATAQSQSGVIGYAILWWLGVPATLLVIIYLIRGH